MSRVSGSALLCLLLVSPACRARAGELRVGSKKFTESVLLAEVAAASLRSHGHLVRHRRQLGGTQLLWRALQRGEIDAYPEYTGTIAREILGGKALSQTALREALASRGVLLGPAFGFDNSYALGMGRARAAALGITRISQLRQHPDLRLGFTAEFLNRADGWPGLRAHYGLPQDRVRGMDHDLAYRGLQSGTLDVVDLYATDADIAYYDLVVLQDDRAFFPEYQAVLLMRDDLDARAREELQSLSGVLDGRAMTALNARVKLDGEAEDRVAAELVTTRLGRVVHASAESLPARLLRHSLDHLFLVVVSLLAAILVAIPLGIQASRRPRWEGPVLGTVGVLQTIPSLALLVFMVPLIGIGAAPAIAALFLYSLLPIVRNTHAGITGISRGVLESAEALGLPPDARMRMIELPLALPSILAGIKTAAVINVGTATLGALIGAGGYGEPILTGIRLDDNLLILEGAIPAALLALLVQYAFGRLELRLVSPGLRLRPEGPAAPDQL